MGDSPIKAIIEITQLRHYLMTLSSFIFFFSIVNIFNTGLNRTNLIYGAIFFLLSSIIFWLCCVGIEYGSEKKIKGNQMAILGSIALFVIWLVLLIVSFCYFIKSIP